jgi:hypothetical protein
LLSDYYPNAYAVSLTLVFLFHPQWTQSSQISGHKKCRVSTRGYSKYLFACRGNEWTLGRRKPKSIPVQHILHGIWWPPVTHPTISHYSMFFAHAIPRYLKWDTSVAVSQSAYLTDSCNNNRNRYLFLESLSSSWSSINTLQWWWYSNHRRRI